VPDPEAGPRPPLDPLLAGFTHEVRNLAFGISAGLDILDSEYAADPALREVTQQLRDQLLKLRGLTEELREYLAPIQLETRRGPASRVVDAASRAVRAAIVARGLALEVAVEPELPAVDLDPVRLERAVALLLLDAVARAADESAGGLEARTATGGGLQLAVTHAGRRWSAERLAEAWAPFAVRHAAGSGLGLPLVRRIVEAHGGRVTAEARPDGGARLGFELPASS